MPRSMKPGDVQILRYLPHGKPVPAGWEIVNTMEGTHHGWHAVIIRKKQGKAE